MIKEAEISNFLDFIKRLQDKKQTKEQAITKLNKIEPSLTYQSKKPIKMLKKNKRTANHSSDPINYFSNSHSTGELHENSKNNFYRIYCQELEKRYNERMYENLQTANQDQSGINTKFLQIENTMTTQEKKFKRIPKSKYNLSLKSKIERKSWDILQQKSIKDSEKIKTSSFYKKLQPSELSIQQINKVKMPKISKTYLVKDEPSVKIKRKESRSKKARDHKNERKQGALVFNKFHKLEGWQQKNYDQMLNSFHF